MTELRQTYCPSCGRPRVYDAETERHTVQEGYELRCDACGLSWTLHSAHGLHAHTAVFLNTRNESAPGVPFKSPSSAENAPAKKAPIAHRLNALSRRESEVLDLIATGHSNKSTARRLGISVSSIEKHRARLMRKIEAKSLADVVRIYLAAVPQRASNPDCHSEDSISAEHISAECHSV